MLPCIQRNTNPIIISGKYSLLYVFRPESFNGDVLKQRPTLKSRPIWTLDNCDIYPAIFVDIFSILKYVVEFVLSCNGVDLSKYITMTPRYVDGKSSAIDGKYLGSSLGSSTFPSARFYLGFSFPTSLLLRRLYEKSPEKDPLKDA